MNVRYIRRYSYFAPSHTYAVHDETGRWLGEVARTADAILPADRRRWHASNRSWADGADLPGTFPTRAAATRALQTAASATDNQP